MATLNKLVSKYGVAGTARIFQAKDHDVTEGRIREAIKVRRGRSPETARANKARLEGYAKEVNLTKEYRKGAPGPEVVSAKVVSSPVKTRTIAGRHGNYRTVESGRRPSIDRANNSETWPLPRRPLHRESLERLVVAAGHAFDGKDIRVKIYGRFLAHRGNYRLSGRGGDLGWREDTYSINTNGRVLEQLLHEVNRDITIELNQTNSKRERKWIEQGGPDDEIYPGYAARWATKLTGGEGANVSLWSEVNWVSIELLRPTVKSGL